eukprot:2813549-Pyramimonas_sp.AAC.1
MSRLPRDEACFAVFADDTGLVAQDIYACLFLVLQVFRLAARADGLCLNVKKTKVAPFEFRGEECVLACVREAGILSKQFEICARA